MPEILRNQLTLRKHCLCHLSQIRKTKKIAARAVAEGRAELYPRFGPTSEWDTAAGQALLEAAGGHVTRPDGHRLRYNCRDSLINGDFLAFSDPSVLAP